MVDIETGREALGVDGHRNRKGELQKKDIETGRGNFRKTVLTEGWSLLYLS